MEKNIIEILKNGGLVIMPTDTQYGLVTPALNQKSVERIYQLKKRSPQKPFIILISSVEDLKLFEITLDKFTRKYLAGIWPNPVSVILPCLLQKFAYLHRGANSLAFRIPDKQDLVNILQKTGPLIAPSANLEGLPVAKTIKKAKKYFGDQVDYYEDGGKLDSAPSTLIKIENGKVQVLRQGKLVVK